MSGFETFLSRTTLAQLKNVGPWYVHYVHFEIPITPFGPGLTNSLSPWAQSSLMDLVTLVLLRLSFGSIHALSGNTQSLLDVSQY